MPSKQRVDDDERAADATEADVLVGAVKGLFDQYHTMSIAAATSPSDPWIAKVFFVDDEPSPGKMDICCALINTSRKLAMMRESLRVAFVVAGDHPDRWAQGTGDVEIVDDDADSDAIMKRLEAKSPIAGPFLRMVPWTAVRVHVDRLKYTDITGVPPVAELTFA
jgi:nitroimidazol reductase NimA-like FMN-containing flavoprotein (pyridoxamine 5'-phosphate oxidase superfamily)